MSDETERYMTVEEFTSELNKRGIRLSEQAVRKWIRQKKIRAIRPGARQWYIPVSELERVLKEGNRVPLTPAGPLIHRPA